MSLADRVKQLEAPRPRLNIQRGEQRGSIHHLGGRLLKTVIVSRGGAWTGEGKV
jgi:hypothetical protein